MLSDGDGRLDSGSKGGGAVNGDASGEASDNDDELPETASSFLFRGDGVSLGAWLGEALGMSALLGFFLLFEVCIFAIQISLPSRKPQNAAPQDARTYGKTRVEGHDIVQCICCKPKLLMW